MQHFGTGGAGWFLGVTRQTIWRWRKQDLLGGYFVGSRWRITREELESFKKHLAAAQRSRIRPTFRTFAALVLNRSRTSLWTLEKKLGQKLTPELLRRFLREQGKQQGRQEMYNELRQQKHLHFGAKQQRAGHTRFLQIGPEDYFSHRPENCLF